MDPCCLAPWLESVSGAVGAAATEEAEQDEGAEFEWWNGMELAVVLSD